MSDIEPEAVDVQEPSGIDPEATPDAAAEPQDTSPASWRDDPDFSEAVRAEAAALLEQRLAAQQTPQPQTQQQDQIDLNEFLNPFGDTYGENVARFLSDRDQHILGQFQQMLAPILQREQAQQEAQGQQLMNQLISERWNEQQDGKLTDESQTAIKDLAPVYLAEMNQRYGETQYAAQQALTKAAETVRAINRAARQAGGQANIDGLAAVQSAPGDVPAGAAGGIDVPDKAKTAGELMGKFFGPNAARLVA